jgi:hypothetical protein
MGVNAEQWKDETKITAPGVKFTRRTQEDLQTTAGRSEAATGQQVTHLPDR